MRNILQSYYVCNVKQKDCVLLFEKSQITTKKKEGVIIELLYL
jgi:hypothetical protein